KWASNSFGQSSQRWSLQYLSIRTVEQWHPRDFASNVPGGGTDLFNGDFGVAIGSFGAINREPVDLAVVIEDLRFDQSIENPLAEIVYVERDVCSVTENDGHRQP